MDRVNVSTGLWNKSCVALFVCSRLIGMKCYNLPLLQLIIPYMLRLHLVLIKYCLVLSLQHVWIVHYNHYKIIKLLALMPWLLAVPRSTNLSLCIWSVLGSLWSNRRIRNAVHLCCNLMILYGWRLITFPYLVQKSCCPGGQAPLGLKSWLVLLLPRWHYHPTLKFIMCSTFLYWNLTRVRPLLLQRHRSTLFHLIKMLNLKWNLFCKCVSTATRCSI